MQLELKPVSGGGSVSAGSREGSLRSRLRSLSDVLFKRRAVDVDAADRQPRRSWWAQFRELLVSTLAPSSNVDYLDILQYAPWIALANIILYVGVFLFLVVTTTQRGMHSKFLALTAPPQVDANCRTVAVANTGAYFADMSGVWNTMPAYSHKPMFELVMTGSLVADYATLMSSTFAAQISELGNRLTTVDIISSQIAWSLFRVADTQSNTVFRAYAQASQLFKSSLSLVPPIFASAKGVCQNAGIPSPTWDVASMTLTATFPTRLHPIPGYPSPPPTLASTSSANPDSVSFDFCPDQLHVQNLTFALYDDPNKYSVDFDVLSAMTAYALNFNLFNTSVLTLVGTYPQTYGPVDNEMHAIVSTWMHDDYPEMQQVICVESAEAPRVCLTMVEGVTPAYPVFSSANSIVSPMLSCLCPRDAKTKGCNAEQGGGDAEFQMTFIYSSSTTTGFSFVSGPGLNSADVNIISIGVNLQRMIASHGTNSVRDIISNWASIGEYFTPDGGDGNPQYFDWLGGSASIPYNPRSSLGNISSFSSFSDSFKALGGGESAALISFLVEYDGTLADFNAEEVSLSDLVNSSLAMCTDSLYRPKAFAQMASVPPVSMVQPYLTCTPSPGAAFISAAGIAAANSALVSSIFLGTALTLVTLWVGAVHEERKLLPPAIKAAVAVERDSRDKEDIYNRLATLETALKQHLQQQDQQQQQPQQYQQQQPRQQLLLQQNQRAVDHVPSPSTAVLNPVHTPPPRL